MEDSATENGLMEHKEKDFRNLPEHLLQMIFCRIPFPSLLKVQALSKTWKGRFLDALQPSSPGGKSFQSDVLSVSHRWPRYCPVFANNRGFLACNRSSRKWQKILVHPFPFPKTLFRFSVISGPYMCLVGQIYDEMNLAVFVVNILTGAYKKLPILPVADGDPQFKSHSFKEPFHLGIDFPVNGLEEQPYPYDIVFSSDQKGYKVYLLFEFICTGEQGEDLRGMLTYVYNSISGTWERLWTRAHRRSLKSTNMCTGSSAILDASLYCMCLDPAHVWKYPVDVRDGLWTNFVQSEELGVGKLSVWGVVACGSLIMVATLPKMESNQRAIARIHQLDKETLLCKEVASITVPSTRRYLRIIADSDNIYFCPAYAISREHCVSLNEYSMLVYSITDKKWSELLLPEISTNPLDNYFLVPSVFEPGLQPFSLG